MDLLSAVRMGVNLKIIRDVEISTVNELFIFTQPAHLQKMERRAQRPGKTSCGRRRPQPPQREEHPRRRQRRDEAARASASAQSARTAPGNPAAKC